MPPNVAYNIKLNLSELVNFYSPKNHTKTEGSKGMEAEMKNIPMLILLSIGSLKKSTAFISRAKFNRI